MCADELSLNKVDIYLANCFSNASLEKECDGCDHESNNQADNLRVAYNAHKQTYLTKLNTRKSIQNANRLTSRKEKVPEVPVAPKFLHCEGRKAWYLSSNYVKNSPPHDQHNIEEWLTGFVHANDSLPLNLFSKEGLVFSGDAHGGPLSLLFSLAFDRIDRPRRSGIVRFYCCSKNSQSQIQNAKDKLLEYFTKAVMGETPKKEIDQLAATHLPTKFLAEYKSYRDNYFVDGEDRDRVMLGVSEKIEDLKIKIAKKSNKKYTEIDSQVLAEKVKNFEQEWLEEFIKRDFFALLHSACRKFETNNRF